MNTALNTSLRGRSRSDAELHRVVRLCTNGAWAIGHSNGPPKGIAIVEGSINYLSGTRQWADWQLERGYREVKTLMKALSLRAGF